MRAEIFEHLIVRKSKRNEPVGKLPMQPEHPPSKTSNSCQKKGRLGSLRERLRSVIREGSKLENLPFVVLIFLAGVSLISRLWLIRH